MPPSSTRCPVCGKKVYRTWQHALADAREVRDRRNHQAMIPYYSRRCRVIHVGQSTNHDRRHAAQG